MTQTQFEALAKGDTLIRVSNGKAYVVSMAFRRSPAEPLSVSARIVKDGKPYGRVYTVTLDNFTLAPQEVK